MRFRKNPVEFEAVQFTGSNWDELQHFCGTREFVSEQKQVFGPMGNNVHWLYDQLDHEPTGELWVEANQTWLPIEIGEWVVKDDLGFYPCKDEIMRKNNTSIEEDVELADITQRADTFERELASVINKHCEENDSGTPDFILARYFVKMLDAFNDTVKDRATWRGEYLELPSLHELREGKRTVPMVVYGGNLHMRNDIGEAVIKLTPGEQVGPIGRIERVIAVFEEEVPTMTEVTEGGE